MKRLLYIVRFTTLSLILAMLLAVKSVTAQNVVYQGQTSTLAVEQMPGDTYEWELYNDGTVNFATTAGVTTTAAYAAFVGGNTGASVTVKWLLPGFYFYKVTARNAINCTNNIKIGMMEVKASLPTAVIAQPIPDWICIGDALQLEVTVTGAIPWEFTFTDGTNSWTVNNINEVTYLLTVNPKVTTQFWITEVKNLNGTNTTPSAKITVVVNPKPSISTIYQHDP